MTVHSLPSPQLSSHRSVITGRVTMLLILLACAAPVIASYFAYYVIRPEGRTNYSTLIEPARALPALALSTLDGRPVASPSLRGQWLLVVVAGGACDASCESKLFVQRQLREMLGRERDRIDKVWLITDAASPSAAMQATANPTGAPLTMLRVDRAALAAWLEPAPGRALEDHLYVVDPMGNWMMRAPAAAEPSRLKSDLSRLLRASGFWDEPGR